MRSEPAYYPLIRIAIGLACGLLGLVATALLGAVLDAPIWEMAHVVDARFGPAGTIPLAVAIPAVGLWLYWWSSRREERRQIAKTGLMEHRHRPFSPDGTARNVLILFAPLALFVLILVGFWLTGTPLHLPRAPGP